MAPILSLPAILARAAALVQQTEIPDSPSPPPSDELIYVTGTRIVAPNRKSASPVETVRREDFTLTGVANVEQTLNQLPQLAPSFTNTSNNPGTGAATLDLRGLGSVRTLILVNGRRWIANDAGQIPEVDVNTIPSALIDRVDIVTGGASAVYGSDAVTGVINFVLKRRLEGLHLEARNNFTEAGDGRSTSADLSYGTQFLGGRGNLLLSAGWLNQAPVFQADRKFSAFTLSDNCIVSGSQDAIGVGQPADSEQCDGPGEEWGLVRGGSFTIPQGRIPGSFLVPNDSGPGLTPLSPTRFSEGGDIVEFFPATESYNFAPLNYLQLPFERISLNLLGSISLSDALEPYTELSYIRTRSPQQVAPAPAAIGTGADSVFPALINLDNPFLTDQARELLELRFGRDAEGDRAFIGNFATGFILNPAYSGDADGFVALTAPFTSRLTGLGPRRVENQRKASRGLIGMRGELGHGWSYDLFYSRSHVKHEALYLNSASALRLQQAMLARADPATGEIACIDPSGGCVPINLFGQQGISPAAAEFLRIDPVERTVVGEQVAEAIVKGDLIQLPAGPLKAVTGTSWRQASYDFRPDNSFEEGDTLGFLASTGASGRTRVFELFGEALVPILERRRWADDLSVELGLRFSDYDSVGGVWTWKAMGNWAPLRSLRFRAGLQKAVRAPNVRELYEESRATVDFANDPCAPVNGFVLTPEIAEACARNGAANLPFVDYETLIRTSGSTNLKAETARTLTSGAVIQPVKGLELTVDYYDIDIRDAIGVFGGGAGFAVVGCIFGGADPADPLCQSYRRDEDGFVAEIDLPTANLARLRARGIDWQANARFALRIGDLHLTLSGTRLIRSDIQFNDNVAAIHCGGSFGAPCGRTISGTATPRWKLFNRASLDIGEVTFSLRHRYFSSTKDARFALAEALGQPPPTDVPVNATRLQARHYFDAAATFEAGDRFELTLGVNNLTNAKPSLAGFQAVQANTDPSLYDVLGRRYFATVSVRIGR